jgi:hypothetical protein
LRIQAKSFVEVCVDTFIALLQTGSL